MIKLFGIPIRIHPLLWFVFAASAFTGYVVELAVLFGVILIHELGHTAAASSFGWRVKQILLLPFGGVAEVEEGGNAPAWQEMIVVAAGPLQNALMVAAGLVCQATGLWGDAWTDYFIRVNLMIGLFNLLPILPLDGGKLLQALISLWLPYYRTLHITFTVSLLLSAMMIAISLGVWNAYGIDVNLLMIGIFLLVNNWVDYRNISYLFIRFLMGREARINEWLAIGVAAQPVMVSHRQTLPQVMKMLKREKFHMLFVCNDKGEIKQALPEQKAIRAFLTRNGQRDRANPAYFSYNKRKLSSRRT